MKDIVLLGSGGSGHLSRVFAEKQALYGKDLVGMDCSVLEGKIIELEQERGITLQNAMNNIDKPYGFDIEGVGILDYISPFARCPTYPLHILDSMSGFIYEEDQTISCKDKSSGVKCLKVKSGSGHWKPFYQTSKF